ncbi:MAG: arsenite efflux transporter metallochaperone ArsD [Actinomycetota bacterium]|nr:arsenite efflux transporter metallochaperone ArsD [Actinomycetota bacterium]
MGVAGVEVRVYDPPLCCASGVCGPSVDPALSQAAADFAWLTDRGVSVTRFNLAQEPAAFAADAKVAGMLAAFGDQALPAVLVGDRILVYGRYPSRDELAEAVGETVPVEEPDMTVGGGCAPGSGCC